MAQNIYEITGYALRRYRLQQGWSQEELGDKAGLHPSYIGQIERNVKKISLVTLQKLALALKINISDLLQEKPFNAQSVSLENKILGLVQDKPSEQQECAYRMLKEFFRPCPRLKK